MRRHGKRRLMTDEDGMARNAFWITDRRGNKLSNYHADMLAERVGDFVVYCTPDQKARSQYLYISHASSSGLHQPCTQALAVTPRASHAASWGRGRFQLNPWDTYPLFFSTRLEAWVG